MPDHVDVPDEAVKALARRFWELRMFGEGLPTWRRLSEEERASKCTNAAAFIAEHIAPAITAKAVEAERERLLSNEICVRVASAFAMRPHQIGEILNSAFAALDSEVDRG